MRENKEPDYVIFLGKIYGININYNRKTYDIININYNRKTVRVRDLL